MRQQTRHRRWGSAGYCALLLSAIGLSTASQAVVTAGPAPDPTGRGDFAVATSQYRLPASTDPTIMTDRATEIWA